jgi:hypothetical protein
MDGLFSIPYLPVKGMAFPLSPRRGRLERWRHDLFRAVLLVSR